jgi:hypothetical protein
MFLRDGIGDKLRARDEKKTMTKVSEKRVATYICEPNEREEAFDSLSVVE